MGNEFPVHLVLHLEVRGGCSGWAACRWDSTLPPGTEFAVHTHCSGACWWHPGVSERRGAEVFRPQSFGVQLSGCTLAGKRICSAVAPVAFSPLVSTAPWDSLVGWRLGHSCRTGWGPSLCPRNVASTKTRQMMLLCNSPNCEVTLWSPALFFHGGCWSYQDPIFWSVGPKVGELCWKPIQGTALFSRLFAAS